jgi:threonine dehydrogenase-like Zn-dependent dehydrogenase
MRGICFRSVGEVAWQAVDEPQMLDSGDAIVRVSLAGLCGSDLHPFFGRESGLQPGTVMGHEFVGEVVETGPAVRRVRVGDVVCAPFSTSCGDCFYCQRGLTSRCSRGQLFGWRNNGIGLHGGQAELVRVPLADSTLVPLGDRPPELGLLLGDNLATGVYCAEMAGADCDGWHVVIGCGTVGLLCILACRWRGVRNLLACDLRPDRVMRATELGARAFADPEELRDAVLSETGGRGADSVMELVGLPAAQRLAFELVRPGGTLSVIGCHCEPQFAFSPVEAYDRNLVYRTGRCPARHYMDRLDPLIGQFEPELLSLVTHRFDPADAVNAYATFSEGRDGCLKAVFDFLPRNTA